ncbi:MAG: hypothetical protein EOM30_10030 [Clostridia bacterium]|jgi:F0F1-type ATP synthase membrane subunit b/b'|nr:hypothetical protein [Clostridia bacterium]NLS86155.1 hypothetical protein [Oscillospiraceae bacterium]
MEESFVDKIIDTDKKAREIIEGAQKEKDLLMAEAEKRAKQEIEARAEDDKKEMAQIDNKYKEKLAAATERANVEYIAAKHALDAAFEKGRKVWLDEIINGALEG